MIIEQERYQVRFDRGLAGARAIAGDADVLVWVDARTSDDPPVRDVPEGLAVVLTDLPHAKAVAEWVVDSQVRVGRRLVIAVVAAGDQRDGQPRALIEDDLAAGAIISYLADLGLDATSPEAAVVEAAYRGLARATSHLFSASVTAMAATEKNRGDRVDAALGATDVRVIRPLA